MTRTVVMLCVILAVGMALAMFGRHVLNAQQATGAFAGKHYYPGAELLFAGVV